jgi:short-subunit dehydrogenase
MKISHSRIALITGASRSLGLGFAVARQLAELDHHVILTARTVEQAEALAADLRRDGFSANALPLDLADPTSISGLITGLTDSIDHLDVLINNASAMPDFETQSALDVDLNALHALFEVNVFDAGASLKHCCRCCGSRLRPVSST